MNSHFQSNDTTSISSGLVVEERGSKGSSLWLPIQITPPRKKIVSVGMDHTINSILPELSEVRLVSGAGIRGAVPPGKRQCRNHGGNHDRQHDHDRVQ